MAKANLELYEYDRQSIQYELWPTPVGRPQRGALGSMGHVAEKRQWAKNLNGKDGRGKA